MSLMSSVLVSEWDEKCVSTSVPLCEEVTTSAFERSVLRTSQLFLSASVTPVNAISTQLPFITTCKGFPVISIETFEQQISKEGVVIDCRFPYEYEAGHVSHSLNLWNENSLIRWAHKVTSQSPVFLYCEFSGTRAPNLARCLQRVNKQMFSELYLIQGGFCDLYSKASSCVNGFYLSMTAPSHFQEFITFSKMCVDYKKRRNFGALSFA
ncbi:hypothetical protein EIN_057180 [Entamoeba invadens IP1]|uniref:hypothetical protein n=1 Tax=Entamoeba invadens IP1 TaxID=370355 RepID=UPI0002C3E172|nr:hypothetical protein EIN_057180 [Entamoeba invadens IP1]ELP93333.1 hypothetical protein EIN_057180 [Entamoeba invadens IP1]|eukprot:XP_004260104.1 hypothetical protein EIN_057180 [Entamoeba invadens IP1]